MTHAIGTKPALHSQVRTFSTGCRKLRNDENRTEWQKQNETCFILCLQSFVMKILYSVILCDVPLYKAWFHDWDIWQMVHRVADMSIQPVFCFDLSSKENIKWKIVIQQHKSPTETYKSISTKHSLHYKGISSSVTYTIAHLLCFVWNIPRLNHKLIYINHVAFCAVPFTHFTLLWPVGFTWFTLCFVFLDSHDSLFCAFLDSRDSRCVLCCWIHVIHNVFFFWIYAIHIIYIYIYIIGLTWFTLWFVFLDSHDSRCVLCCWIHTFHSVLCVFGFTWFTMCLCFWIYAIRVVFCFVGFRWFTLCFVLFYSHNLPCVSCFWIHKIHAIFYRGGTTCVTLSSVPFDSVLYYVLFSCHYVKGWNKPVANWTFQRHFDSFVKYMNCKNVPYFLNVSLEQNIAIIMLSQSPLLKHTHTHTK